MTRDRKLRPNKARIKQFCLPKKFFDNVGAFDFPVPSEFSIPGVSILLYKKVVDTVVEKYSVVIEKITADILEKASKNTGILFDEDYKVKPIIFVVNVLRVEHDAVFFRLVPPEGCLFGLVPKLYSCMWEILCEVGHNDQWLLDSSGHIFGTIKIEGIYFKNNEFFCINSEVAGNS